MYGIKLPPKCFKSYKKGKKFLLYLAFVHVSLQIFIGVWEVSSKRPASVLEPGENLLNVVFALPPLAQHALQSLTLPVETHEHLVPVLAHLRHGHTHLLRGLDVRALLQLPPLTGHGLETVFLHLEL